MSENGELLARIDERVDTLLTRDQERGEDTRELISEIKGIAKQVNINTTNINDLVWWKRAVIGILLGLLSQFILTAFLVFQVYFNAAGP